MEISTVRVCYENGLVEDFIFHTYFSGFTMSFYLKGNLRTVCLARGGQKIYKTFESLLKDYKYITGQDSLALKVVDDKK